jgi:predicted nuclease with TOPRIM domain
MTEAERLAERIAALESRLTRIEEKMRNDWDHLARIDDAIEALEADISAGAEAVAATTDFMAELMYETKGLEAVVFALGSFLKVTGVIAPEMMPHLYSHVVNLMDKKVRDHAQRTVATFANWTTS